MITLNSQKNKLAQSPFLKNPLIVALDVDSREQALQLADDVSDFVGALKVGPRLIMRYGQSLLKELSSKLPLFVDCKFFDIPSTMEASVRASYEAGASLVTVHAMSGYEALSRLAALEQELNAERAFKILAVTILTSWDQESLPSVMKDQQIKDHVLELSQLVKKSGLSGLVCSPEELTALKDQGLFLVTPGIRFEKHDKDDQKRVMSPKEALQAGASGLVVGRPIVQAKNPKEAALDYSLSLYEI